MKLALTTITDQNFLASYDVLSKLSLPARTSYWIARVARAVNAANQDFQTARIGIFKELGTLNEATRQYTIDTAEPAKIAAFNAAIEPLLAEEVDLPITEPIPLPPNVAISAADLMQLLDIVSLADDPPSSSPAPVGKT